MWYLHKMQCYVAIKKNKVDLYILSWNSLEDIVSKNGKIQKNVLILCQEREGRKRGGGNMVINMCCIFPDYL